MSKWLSSMLTIVNIFLFSAGAMAQTPKALGALFLKNYPGARATGMGGAFTALADDGSAIWWNPAGLASISGLEAASTYYGLLPQWDLTLYYSYNSLILSPANFPGTFGVNLFYNYYGKTEGRDENNMPTGTVTSYDMAASAAFGTSLNERLDVGAAGKYIYRHLADQGAGAEKGTATASSWAVDLGLMVHRFLIPHLTVAADLANMGPAIESFNAFAENQKSPIPQTLRLGVSFAAFDMQPTRIFGHRLTLNTNLEKELVDWNDDGSPKPFYQSLVSAWDNGPMLPHFGWEYWFVLSFDKAVLKGGVRNGFYRAMLRMPYNYDKIELTYSPSTVGFSLGAETKIGATTIEGRFDFTHVNANEDPALDNRKVLTFTLAAR